jgi:glycerol uptake facilitator-like aquaporin
VAIARSMTNTFAGIRPADLVGFIAAQIVGALIATGVLSWLLRSPVKPEPDAF